MTEMVRYAIEHVSRYDLSQNRCPLRDVALP